MAAIQNNLARSRRCLTRFAHPSSSICELTTGILAAKSRSRKARQRMFFCAFCAFLWRINDCSFLHCRRVAGPATKTGGEPPPLHVRTLLEDHSCFTQRHESAKTDGEEKKDTHLFIPRAPRFQRALLNTKFREKANLIAPDKAAKMATIQKKPFAISRSCLTQRHEAAKNSGAKPTSIEYPASNPLPSSRPLASAASGWQKTDLTTHSFQSLEYGRRKQAADILFRVRHSRFRAF
jgi:hypothetical protein